jgi:predicted lactoylglutathione lyase
MQRQIYVNLPIRELKTTLAFFSGLGFEFNSNFSNDDAACMIIGENIYAMLLTEPFFKTFLTTTSISDAKKTTEVLICINAESREKVDEMFKKAISLGGNAYRAAQDHGFMYAQAFQDLDGHIWEVMWMDPKVGDT